MVEGAGPDYKVKGIEGGRGHQKQLEEAGAKVEIK